MGGQMKELSLSTNIPSTGVNASLFLQFLTPTRVERLNVSDNSFSGDLPHRLFSLNDLTELYIRNFMNTPNLRILDISLNQLKEVPKGLSTLTQLEDLDLSGQRIGTPFIVTNEMYNMKKLRSLKMSRLPTLQNIYSNCGISNLRSDTFSDLHLLEILILSNNNIATIPSNIFKPLKSLSKLYLNSNKIGNNPQITVDTIDTLDLSKNKIKTPNKLISEGTIQNLNLSRNDIVNWTGEYKWLRGNNSKILNLNSTEDLTCNEPYTLYGKSVLEVQYNSTLCDVIAPDYALIFGTPFGILLILVAASIILGFEIAYVRHLFNVKKRNEREEKQGCVYDLFVSYSSKDREWVVNVLLEKLESADEGYQLCLHERDFLLGTYIMDNVISNDFLILLELKRLDREKLPLHLRQLMVSRTYLEWPNDLTVSKQENFWARLKAALGKPLTHKNKVNQYMWGPLYGGVKRMIEASDCKTRMEEKVNCAQNYFICFKIIRQKNPKTTLKVTNYYDVNIFIFNGKKCIIFATNEMKDIKFETIKNKNFKSFLKHNLADKRKYCKILILNELSAF
ncbi:hypothetical protein B566_EDAN013963 [Ephemera danica]|nr:hypothetical protein B566_EDAN013963 [Ephemera danica]